MPLKLFGLLVVVTVLLVQATYVLWTGQALLFFAKREYRHSPVGPLRRLAFAFAWVFPVGMMAFLVARAINGKVIGLLKDWFAENAGILFWMSLLALCGALCLAQPAGMLRWMLREHPELAEDRRMLNIVRLIGSGMLLMYLFALANM